MIALSHITAWAERQIWSERRAALFIVVANMALWGLIIWGAVEWLTS